MNCSFLLFRRGTCFLGFCLFQFSLLSVQGQAPVLKQIRNTGPRSTHFNVVILSEGYTSAELTSKFPADANALLNAFLANEPYKDYASYLNVFTIAVPSAESGSDHPSLNQYHDTYFNSTYDSYGLDRLLTIPPNDIDGNYADGEGKVEALLTDLLPDYDLLLMVVNDPIYGGSGGPVAIASTNVDSAEIAVHESGHTLGHLADEYDTPGPNFASESPNATQETRRDFIRWHDWILPSTPIPTPEDPVKFGGVIGLFEGANYHPTGWYRPKFECKMNTLGYPFCEVCTEALVIGIYQYLSLITTVTPDPTVDVALDAAATQIFTAETLQPVMPTISETWTLDGDPIPGASGSSVTLYGAFLSPGSHVLRVDAHDNTALVRNDPSDDLAGSTSWNITVGASGAVPPQLLNISTRMEVLSGDNVLIGGFIIIGNAPKKVLLRAIGPSLESAGISGVLADPVLELHMPDMTVVTNDNWKATQQAEIEATGLQPSKDLESALVETLAPGAYTAIVSGKNGGTGVGLVEAYDLDEAADSTLANISTRGFVDTGDNVMIGGVIIGGGTASVLVRAIGPELTAIGVSGALQDTTLELHDQSGAIIASNDDWKESQQAEIVATKLQPKDDREAAILATLAPGDYTAILRGKDNTTGVALIEAYNISP